MSPARRWSPGGERGGPAGVARRRARGSGAHVGAALATSSGQRAPGGELAARRGRGLDRGGGGRRRRGRDGRGRRRRRRGGAGRRPVGAGVGTARRRSAPPSAQASGAGGRAAPAAPGSGGSWSTTSPTGSPRAGAADRPPGAPGRPRGGQRAWLVADCGRTATTSSAVPSMSMRLTSSSARPLRRLIELPLFTQIPRSEPAPRRLRPSTAARDRRPASRRTAREWTALDERATANAGPRPDPPAPAAAPRHRSSRESSSIWMSLTRWWISGSSRRRAADASEHVGVVGPGPRGGPRLAAQRRSRTAPHPRPGGAREREQELVGLEVVAVQLRQPRARRVLVLLGDDVDAAAGEHRQRLLGLEFISSTRSAGCAAASCRSRA